MDTAYAWQQLFENWPTGIPKRGLIVTSFQETMGFTDFMIAEGLLAIERDRPDSVGARKVIIAFSAISAVKTTDTDDFATMSNLGFRQTA